VAKSVRESRARPDVRFWPKADISYCTAQVRRWGEADMTSRYWGKADMSWCTAYVCF
jgi:hypothetical protein